MYKNQVLTSDLFKDRKIIQTVGNHPIFKDPTKAIPIKKVFPSIGLSNFSEEANIDKCLIDVKKDGSYVCLLLAALSNHSANARDQLTRKADQMRFLESSPEKRLTNASKIDEIYECAYLLDKFAHFTDPTLPEVKDNSIISSNGKIELRLYTDIIGIKNNDPLYKKGISLIKLYGKLRERIYDLNLGLEMALLDRLPEKKIFDKENIPNKKYFVVFSSDGKEGAWDLLTMSMRGLKSCQSWESDYPQCIIGSIISRFVGIIYLTSGVMAESHENWGSLGTKMLKRCIVRYVFDRELNDGKGGPVLLLDRLYPDKDNPDREILKLFLDKLEEKSKLPVYYGPDLKNRPAKLKNLYYPNDKNLLKIANRERSYQDTPLRTKQEFDLQILVNMQTETKRYSDLFPSYLAIYLAQQLEKDYHNRSSLEPNLKKIINSIRLNSSFTNFAHSVIPDVLAYSPVIDSAGVANSREYYKQYLKTLFFARTQLQIVAAPILESIIANHISLESYDSKQMINYIFDNIYKFIKQQIIKPYFSEEK